MEDAAENAAPRFVARLSATAEAASGARIPLAITGTWARGKERFAITKKDLENIVRNFRARQNGEINVDYDHASEQPEVGAGGPVPSAGRIVAMDPPEEAEAGHGPSGTGERRASQAANQSEGQRFILWGWYEPTTRATELIRSREYRYISPAIDWGARSKRTGRFQGATITSVALTNRPFLEELPEIRLSDPAYRLIDVNGVHVETAIGNDDADGRSDEGRDADRPSADQKSKEEAMKKVHLDVENDMVRVSHPDFADEYYADQEDLKSAMRELGIGPEPAVSVNPDPENITLSQAGTLCSEAAARGKAVPAEDVFRARVEQAIEDATRAGKILPRQRDDWRRIALADFATFTRLMSDQKARVPLAPMGVAGGARADVATEVRLLAEQRMRERGMTFGQALTEIGREQPALVREYRRSVTAD